MIPSRAQPVERGLDLGGRTVDLADDPAPVLLDVGPADVRLHVELADHAWRAPARRTSDSGNVSLTLTRTWLTAPPPSGPRPRRTRLRLPERNPSRSSATNVNPAARTAATTSSRRATTSSSAAGLDLEPGGVPVVAHAQLPEAERAQRRLGLLDRGQAAQRDRRAVGQPRGQAGRGRLVPGAQAEPARPVPDVVLGEAGLDQGKAGAGGRRGGLARAVVAQVAHVHPEDHRGVLGRGQGPERGHQRRLAAGAAVGAVGHVRRRPPSRRSAPRPSAGPTRRPGRGSPPPRRRPARATAPWRTAPRRGPGCRGPPWPASDESAPPLNATTTRPSRRSSSSRHSRDALHAATTAVRSPTAAEAPRRGSPPCRCRRGRTRRRGPRPRRSASRRRTP